MPLIKEQDLRKASTACFIGNFVEWFDYAAYGYFAVIISKVFFPEQDSTAALLSTFAVFAISFIVRPFGGIFWGTIGDKFGRRNALSWSILIMSVSTFLIALIPSYALIGVFAPILLLILRMVQGFSASGEYAGASAFLAEYAPKGKRGIYTSIVPASTAAGLLLGSLMAAVMTNMLSEEFMLDWGWRIPFLMAGPMGLIGRYIRLKLQKTPHFQAMEEKNANHHTPIKHLFIHHRRQLVIAFMVASLNAVAFYLVLSYMPTYLSQEIGIDETTSFIATSVSLFTYIGLIFLMGTLSDRFGRKKMLMAACVVFIVFTVPLFSILNTESVLFIILIEIVFGAMLSMNDGTLPAFLSEIFPTNVRYTGFAFTFNLANALLGGTAPLIATWLIDVTGSKLAPAWYLIAIAVVAVIAMAQATERSRDELR
ncbi:MFS transporter [Cardiobacteriaceae bacterium TAE3-ERU3]|nr:MFS transporter [Cardiobacteriaceae bacterium TAE3-ERU3]